MRTARTNDPDHEPKGRWRMSFFEIVLSGERPGSRRKIGSAGGRRMEGGGAGH